MLYGAIWAHLPFAYAEFAETYREGQAVCYTSFIHGIERQAGFFNVGQGRFIKTVIITCVTGSKMPPGGSTLKL